MIICISYDIRALRRPNRILHPIEIPSYLLFYPLPTKDEDPAVICV